MFFFMIYLLVVEWSLMMFFLKMTKINRVACVLMAFLMVHSCLIGCATKPLSTNNHATTSSFINQKPVLDPLSYPTIHYTKVHLALLSQPNLESVLNIFLVKFNQQQRKILNRVAAVVFLGLIIAGSKMRGEYTTFSRYCNKKPWLLWPLMLSTVYLGFANMHDATYFSYPLLALYLALVVVFTIDIKNYIAADEQHPNSSSGIKPSLNTNVHDYTSFLAYLLLLGQYTLIIKDLPLSTQSKAWKIVVFLYATVVMMVLDSVLSLTPKGVKWSLTAISQHISYFASIYFHEHYLNSMIEPTTN